MQGGRKEWLTRAFAELARVVRPGAAVIVLLPPPLPPLPGSLDLRGQHPIRLLGLKTTIWQLTAR